MTATASDLDDRSRSIGRCPSALCHAWLCLHLSTTHGRRPTFIGHGQVLEHEHVYTGSLVMLDEAGGQRREGSARPGQKCPSVGCKPLGT